MEITSRATIDHPIDEVWAVLSDFAGLQAWHPGLLTCETEGIGVDSVRRVTLKYGRGATERLDVLDEAQYVLVYSVIESIRPATIGTSAWINLTKTDDHSTLVEWIVSSPHAEGFPDDIADGMRAYYPSRIQDLADEVGRRAAGI